jgi:outer membrane protein assembly factor BamA
MTTVESFSQQSVNYIFVSKDTIPIEVQNILKCNKDRLDSTKLFDILSSQKQKLYKQGYFASSFDSVFSKGNSYNVITFIGPKTKTIFINSTNAEPIYLQGTNLELGKKYDLDEIEPIKEKILKNAENKGYPFASVNIDSIELKNNLAFEAKLSLIKNDEIHIDTIIINGKARIRNKFLSNYLKLKPNSLYNESNIKGIKKHISDLGYIEEERQHTISFLNDKATINLYLKNRKTSKFDFLVGFLPNNSATGKLLVTGQARLYLVNPFGTGGEFYADWQKLQPKTQRLQLALSYPYFLNLPFGFDGKFDLYKRDTSNLDINYRIGVLYNFSGNHYIKGFFDNRTTRLLNADTNQIKNTLKLPRILDTKNSLYGLEYYFDNLNYKYNPTSGNFIKLLFGAGIKKFEKNNLITRLKDPFTGESLESLYNILPNKSVQFQIGIEYEKYWKIKKRSTFKTAVNAKSFISKNIFENEMYRIGGNRSIRGFDEESIFTPYYSIFTAEYRFLLSKNSYFYTFFDLAIVEDSRCRGQKLDTPFGFGTGVSLETKIGVFGISYALGKQLNNKIEFRNSKIHFGYISYF